jgi:hypothetical protein
MSTIESLVEKISTDDGEEVTLLYTGSPNESKHISLRSKLCFWAWILLRVSVVSYVFIITFLYFHQRTQRQCLLGQEAIYNDPPLSYKRINFQQAGFHDLAHNNRTVYEGRPNHENNKAWERLMSGNL